jgi:hypothetical protein
MGGVLWQLPWPARERFGRGASENDAFIASFAASFPVEKLQMNQRILEL